MRAGNVKQALRTYGRQGGGGSRGQAMVRSATVMSKPVARKPQLEMEGEKSGKRAREDGREEEEEGTPSSAVSDSISPVKYDRVAESPLAREVGSNNSPAPYSPPALVVTPRTQARLDQASPASSSKHFPNKKAKEEDGEENQKEDETGFPRIGPRKDMSIGRVVSNEEEIDLDEEIETPEEKSAREKRRALLPVTAHPTSFYYGGPRSERTFAQPKGIPAKQKFLPRAPTSSAERGLLVQQRLSANFYPGSPRQVAGTGLRNLGNTCYMNAVLQMLLGIPAFVRRVTDATQMATFSSMAEGSASSSFYMCFCEFVRQAESRQSSVVSPTELKRIMGQIDSRFQGYNQEDAHEFFSHVLNAIDEDLDILGLEHGPSYECFSLAMKQELSCCLCEHIKALEEDYLDLSLHLPEAIEKTSLSLEGVLADFMAAETVEWTCPGCNGKGQAAMTHVISRCPRTLVLHLKRFDGDGKKLVTPVTLPLTLDLQQYVSGATAVSARYTLKSLVVHIGTTIRSGHYICFSQGSQDGRWRRYNDSRVDFVDESTALENTKNAYILCYEQDSSSAEKTK